jgi:hypothetical protein
VYVADHYVLPALTRAQVDAIAADPPTLFLDDLVAEVVQTHFGFRFAPVSDYATALAVEAAVRRGVLAAGPPRLNPQRGPRRRRPPGAAR